MSFKNLIFAAGKAGLLSAALNVILFYAFKLAGIITDDILIGPTKEPMTVVPIILSSIVPSLLSAIVLYAILRFTKKGFLIFTVIAIILLIASFANPFMAITDVTISYAIALNIMHVVVVAMLLYFYKTEINQAQRI